ncbi:catalase-related domain-containing protein, partial [Klebsiella pneumoniae]|uniref:catalase-related domain-containing protein n=1 Tax=Klebsiella pneumoniae TaxID=573 RepID=UPI003C6D9EED
MKNHNKNFLNFYSQTKLFYNNINPIKKQHIKKTFYFKIKKYKSNIIKTNIITLLNHINHQLTQKITNIIKTPLPKKNHKINSNTKSPT